MGEYLFGPKASSQFYGRFTPKIGRSPLMAAAAFAVITLRAAAIILKPASPPAAGFALAAPGVGTSLGQSAGFSTQLAARRKLMKIVVSVRRNDLKLIIDCRVFEIKRPAQCINIVLYA